MNKAPTTPKLKADGVIKARYGTKNVKFTFGHSAAFGSLKEARMKDLKETLAKLLVDADCDLIARLATEATKRFKTLRQSGMPLYYFEVAHGKYSGASDGPLEFKDDATAWQEMTKVCGDLIGDICRDLKNGSDWHMELLDEDKKPLFRVRLIAESLV